MDLLQQEDDSFDEEDEKYVHRQPLDLTREDLLEQWRLAKELRARLEGRIAHAALCSLEERRKLLESSRQDLLELSALQDAVYGEFSLANYKHYTPMVMEEK